LDDDARVCAILPQQFCPAWIGGKGQQQVIRTRVVGAKILDAGNRQIDQILKLSTCHGARLSQAIFEGSIIKASFTQQLRTNATPLPRHDQQQVRQTNTAVSHTGSKLFSACQHTPREFAQANIALGFFDVHALALIAFLNPPQYQLIYIT
jgi:hypothetical protein